MKDPDRGSSGLRQSRTWLWAASLTLPLATGCIRPPPAEPEPARPSLGQRTVDDSLAALEKIRGEPGHAALDSCMRCARGVMIFPYVTATPTHWHGNGVLLARDAVGRWSAPAFYSLGAPGVTPLLGGGPAVILVLLSDRALGLAVDRGLTFNIDNPEGNDRDICQFVNAGALYGGPSLSATVAQSSDAVDLEYYGPGASTRAIVLERRFDHPDRAALQANLSEMTRPSEPAAPCGEPTRVASTTVPGGSVSGPVVR
jgi:SH3 domain-containing YSC84-like protein 1